MKLFNKKYLAAAVALAATANVNTVFAFADENPIDWTGVGNCHIVPNNFLPPGRGGLEQFGPISVGGVAIPTGGAGPVPGPTGPEGRSYGWIGHPCPQLHPNHYPVAAGGDNQPNGNEPGVAMQPGHFFGSIQTFDEATGTYTVTTPEGQFVKRSPFDEPPGSNFINTVNRNLVSFVGKEMPNTQPSALGSSDYMLHDGPVIATNIDKTSPAQDLDAIIDKLEASYKKGAKISKKDIQFALDIIEGNPVDRAYSGLPLLHYNGPNKHKFIIPTTGIVETPATATTPAVFQIDANGNVIEVDIPGFDPVNPDLSLLEDAFGRSIVVGGHVDIDMIYYDQHIESSVILISPTYVQNVTWKANYHVKVLTGGIEDFSPMLMTFDQVVDARVDPPIEGRGPFHASMDQSYFPMLEEGKQYDITIKETYGKHLNLVYTWGWRIHPPRVQVMENATKVAGGFTLLQHEENVFGTNPQGIGLPPAQARENQLAAIAMIGDLSPTKRMWNAFNKLAGKGARQNKYKKKNDHHRWGGAGFDEYVYLSRNQAKKAAEELRSAYFDWSDRLRLPKGVKADPDATLTLLYVNNTFYGSKVGTTGTGVSGDDSGQGPAAFKGNCNGCAHDWDTRPYNYKVTLLNGDHFPHAYMNVDFGGTRGWENQFQDTDPASALNPEAPEGSTTIVGDDHLTSWNNVPNGDGNIILEDVDMGLDTTNNPSKQSLRNVPEKYDLQVGGATLPYDDVNFGSVVPNGEPMNTHDRVFPMNTGGTEEFLEESPRAFDVNGVLVQNPTQLNPPVNNFGSGCYFTFGRHHAWPNAGGPWGGIVTPPVDPVTGVPTKRKVEIQYNFEPSRRLKIYQFDPLHHDVAVYSLH